MGCPLCRALFPALTFVPAQPPPALCLNMQSQFIAKTDDRPGQCPHSADEETETEGGIWSRSQHVDGILISPDLPTVWGISEKGPGTAECG